MTKKNLFEEKLSIFRPSEDMKEKDKRYWRIHGNFKKVLLVPICYFVDKFIDRWLGKYVITKKGDIPKVINNINMHILWDSFEHGLKKWHTNFYRIKKNVKGEQTNKKKVDKAWKNRKKYHWYRIPHLFRKLLFTIIIEDTAYREQVNTLLHEIQGRMNKAWNPEIKHEFPYYTNKFDMDLAYFFEWCKIRKETKLLIVDIKNGNINVNLVPDNVKKVEINVEQKQEMESGKTNKVNKERRTKDNRHKKSRKDN